MSRRKKIYEGKAKILYEGPEPGTFIQYFKDDATAFNAQKKGDDQRQGRDQQPPDQRARLHTRSHATSASRPISFKPAQHA